VQISQRRQSRDLSPFEATIGKLVSEAFAATPVRSGRRLPKDQWESIAAQADAAGFVLKEHIEGKWKFVLASWNQKHSRRPDGMITTFSGALKSDALRCGVLRTFYRAKNNYIMICSEKCPVVSSGQVS
jgi:hypothetical protein